MTQSEIVQVVGSCAIVLLGVGLYFIAHTNGRYFLAYGREAMMASAVGWLVVAAVRFGAVPANAITQTQAREINGIIGIVFALIVLQDVAIILIHMMKDRKQEATHAVT